MNLSFENHCVSNSPSKIEGGRGEYEAHFIVIILLSRFATAPLILEEQLDIQLFIFVELALKEILHNRGILARSAINFLRQQAF